MKSSLSEVEVDECAKWVLQERCEESKAKMRKVRGAVSPHNLKARRVVVWNGFLCAGMIGRSSGSSRVLANRLLANRLEGPPAVSNSVQSESSEVLPLWPSSSVLHRAWPLLFLLDRIYGERMI